MTDLHAKLKAAGVAIHIAATGGGAGAQAALWSFPGSSAYLSGASFPYAREELTNLLGFEPEQFCSPETAVDLACVAYMRAFRFGGKRAIGLGLSAAVASDRERRGADRVHACVITDGMARVASVELPRGAGAVARADHGQLCDTLALDLVREAALSGGATHYENKAVFSRILARPFFAADGRRHVAAERVVGLLPGAFNPPHDGHFTPRTRAERMIGGRVAFQLTIDTPHKPRLSPADVLQRAAMLRGHDLLVTQGYPLYVDKARRFPGKAFVIGADALARMLDDRWGPQVTPMLCELSELGASFVVAPRRVNGRLLRLHDVLDAAGVHPDRRFLFRELDGVDVELSSSAMRAAV